MRADQTSFDGDVRSRYERCQCGVGFPVGYTMRVTALDPVSEPTEAARAGGDSR